MSHPSRYIGDTACTRFREKHDFPTPLRHGSGVGQPHHLRQLLPVPHGGHIHRGCQVEVDRSIRRIDELGGERNVSIDNIARIADALGIRIGDLFPDSGGGS